MKKFLITLAAALVLCVPAFASDVYFSDTLHVASGRAEYDLSFIAPHTGYFFAIENDYSYCISLESGTGVVSVSGLNGIGNPYSITANCIQSYGTYFGGTCQGLVYGDSYTLSPNIAQFPSGTTKQQVADAFTEFLNSSVGTGNKVTVHVPYGNVLYIKVDQRQDDIQLVAHMPKLSFLIPDRNYGYWGETGICWGDYNTLPYSGLTFPLNGMSGIDWQRDSSRNILGQTKTGVATKIMNTGVWYALFCPSLFGHFELDSSSALPGASVDITGVFSDIRLYPLSDSYSFINNEVINGSDSEFQDYLEGESTESGTVTWTDQDGNVSAPRAGGSSYVPEAETAESLVSQIKNILGNIVKELQTLFTFGYDAIQTLVNLMSDFVSGFSQLYTWLPAPVYSALIAAITVAIVIGVFKVFL